MIPRTNLQRLLSMLIFAALASSAIAVQLETESPRDGPDLAALQHQIETGDAAAAEKQLRAANKANPENADVLNLLGYANRKLERYAVSRDFYERALKIDPGHKGALEYKGELELQTGNVGVARKLLARLRVECPEGCPELDDLLQAFDAAGEISDGEDS